MICIDSRTRQLSWIVCDEATEQKNFQVERRVMRKILLFCCTGFSGQQLAKPCQIEDSTEKVDPSNIVEQDYGQVCEQCDAAECFKSHAPNGSFSYNIGYQGIASKVIKLSRALHQSRPIDLESTQNNALTKLPLLKQGDYDTWRLIIESYIQLQDYALWEIIEDGNSFKLVARTTTNADGTSTSTIPGAVTAEEKIQKKIDLKARSILMMTLPNSEVHNNKTCSKTCLKSFEDLKSQYDNLRIELNKSKFDLANYKRGLASVEEQLVFYKKNKGMLCDQIVVLKRDALFNESEINALKIQIERLKKEKESNQIKIYNFENASKSLDKLIGSQISKNNRKGVGYNVVAPLPTGLFAPPTIDLSNSGLEEFKQPNLKDMELRLIRVLVKIPLMRLRKPLVPPIIKDWVSDCDEDKTLEKVSESANVQKPKQADQPRKISQNPRNNSTNWNTPMSKKLGVGFQFTPKACFVCGSFNQLIKDYNFHDKKMVQKPILNNEKKGTAVLTKSGLVPISVARQSSSRTAATVSTARPIKTVAPKPFVNVAKTRPNAFQKSHSPSRRPFYQQTTLKNINLNNKVNTIKANSVNTAKGKRVTSAVREQGIDAAKSKACWVWRPRLKDLDHVSKNSRSYMCKQFDYVDPTGRVKHQELASPEQTVSGKDFSNPLIVDSLLKTIWFINAPYFYNKALAIPGQTATVYVAPSLKQKLFSNMKIRFSGVHVPLFDTMLLHDQPGQGEGPTVFVESQHIPTASSPSKSQPTTSQPTSSQVTSSQAPHSHEPTTEPIITTSSTHPQEIQIPQTTSSMPYDSPLPGGYTSGSVEGSMQLKELTNLYTKLVARVTSLETELKKTKEVHGKALTKLVKKVKRLEDKLKSTNKRKKAKMVISDEEKELVSDDSSKQGRMEETEYADVKEENAGVEYDFDLTEQQVTSLKTPQVEEQSQEMFEVELSVLSATKILVETSKKRVKTYNRRRRSTDSSQVSTVVGLFSTAKEIQDTDEELAKKFDQERKAAHDIDWSKIVEQAQERLSGSMISYDQIKPIFEEEYRKVQTLFKNDYEVSKSEKKRVAEEALLQESFKKLRTAQASGSRKYWNIIRVGNITEAYQGFEDMLKAFDGEDLDTLWSLVKEKFRSIKPFEDMERALWVELKRIYEPNKEDTLWKLQRYMHDPLTWRLYGSCAVHHVFSTRGHCIYMLPEKDYPLTAAVMMLMLSRRLQVEEDSEMARNLVKKIYIEANRSRS
ncbi:hypothetical protein Tco_0109055 [Tanacetum coccineum]